MKNKVLQFLFRELILFLIGGFIYVTIEIVARGFSHWSMFIVGGLCFVIIGLINEWYTENIPLLIQMLIGTFVIVALELISGYIINIKLGWNVWDYSNKPFNFAGQICLSNSCCWFILSGVAIYLDDWIRWKFFKENKPHYR